MDDFLHGKGGVSHHGNYRECIGHDYAAERQQV